MRNTASPAQTGGSKKRASFDTELVMQGLRYWCVCYLARHELPFRAYYGLHRDCSKLVISQETDVVIEGFPRCGNTFAAIAFAMAQSEPVRLAHHLHAQVQIQKAIQWRIPVLVLTRDPVSAVASFVTREPDVTVSQALIQYGRFYRYVLACLENVVIADFHEITTNYAAVIQRLNARFGKVFKPYANSEEEDAKVFASIDALNKVVESGDWSKAARPLSVRKESLDAAARKVALHPLVPEMTDLHRRFLAQPMPSR